MPPARSRKRAEPEGRAARALGGALLAAAALLAAGCGTVYVNAEDEFPRYEHESAFESEQGLERTYRRLYARLLECTGAYYRVRGDLDKAAGAATIRLDTGAGFERMLYLADSHVMRIDIEQRGPSQSTVSVSVNQRDPPPFVAIMARWVNEDHDGCRE